MHRIAVKISDEWSYDRDGVTNEFKTYRALRAAGLEGKVVPVCLGLFERDDMTILLTVYSGNAIKTDFEQLSIEDRLQIYRAAYAIEDAGIQQNSFSPRNVVCDDNGAYRILDFHRGEHDPKRRATPEHMKQEYIEWGELNLEQYHVVPIPEVRDEELEELRRAGGQE